MDLNQLTVTGKVMQVMVAYPIEQPELNANPNLNRDISNALDTLDFDKLTNQLNGASK